MKSVKNYVHTEHAHLVYCDNAGKKVKKYTQEIIDKKISL